MFLCSPIRLYHHLLPAFHVSICPFFPLQCSSQSDPSNATQQVQLLLGEKQQLEAHNHQVCEHGGSFSYSYLHMCYASG